MRIQMRRNMLRYAYKATYGEALIDIGWSPASWQDFQRAAAALGQKQTLLDHVEGKLTATSARKYDKCGVIAPGVFIPLPWMTMFRQSARTLSSTCSLPVTRKRIH